MTAVLPHRRPRRRAWSSTVEQIGQLQLVGVGWRCPCGRRCEPGDTVFVLDLGRDAVWRCQPCTWQARGWYPKRSWAP